MRPASLALVLLVVLAGCTPPAGDPPSEAAATSLPAPSAAATFPPAPRAPAGDLDPAVGQAVERLMGTAAAGTLDRAALATVAGSQDARLAWLLADLLRFFQQGSDLEALAGAFRELTGVDPDRSTSVWRDVTDTLIAWDLPAPPAYRERKADVFLAVEPGWEPFFADADADIDWRLLSWGGVRIDDRPAGDPSPCPGGCIPALDDPALTPAADGDWYPDGRLVFGVVVSGEAAAFPKHMMEVHELVNVTVGGRRLGIPYCTLCGSAQAYLTDAVPAGVEPPVLRTSGLLSRSNKVMYDLRTRSVFDTFTGDALSGPLQDAGLALEQVTVVASTWGEWKRAHPETTIVAEDGGIGRRYPDDPLRGRDDAGPIFPIGPVDPRLPVQAQVLGVIGPDGSPIAFPVDDARAALADGRPVTVGDVEVLADGGGLRARTRDVGELPAHQAFWFAWSQFHPATAVWTPLDRPTPGRSN